ncbi:MAG: hypothetical protein L0323_09935, partial [Planctomycetes bacterium]|nr:hypothetical protein [Planctomycetota bacterium]
MLSEVAFGAFLQYSPHGKSEVSETSRKWRDAVKHDEPGAIRSIVHTLAARLPATGLDAFLGPDIALIPAPRSSPLRSRDALWPARRICEELVEEGLGSEVLEIVSRREAVPKSAFARRGGRPGPEDHLRSLALEGKLLPPQSKLTVVDDFVTRGATLLAVASLVQQAFPEDAYPPYSGSPHGQGGLPDRAGHRQPHQGSDLQ